MFVKDWLLYVLNLLLLVSLSVLEGWEVMWGCLVLVEELDVVDFVIYEWVVLMVKVVMLLGDKCGWLLWVVEGWLYLFGWVWLLGVVDVCGVEVELVVLVLWLGGLMFVEVSGGEGYVLCDDKGCV